MLGIVADVAGDMGDTVEEIDTGREARGVANVSGAAIAEELFRYFAGTDEKAKDISESEQEENRDEAIRSVRPGYRAIW
jgi:hypothetical protein